jgi:hypothetical protein
MPTASPAGACNKQVWRDVRATRAAKAKSCPLEMLVVKGPGEMDYL